MKRFLFFLLVPTLLLAQINYPKDYFAAPLDIPLQLSGNFGELRSNHFHAGFDFKTLQKEGLPVKASASGYVSRIKIAESGYGKALYITHPNGFTSVYGHLQSGFGKFEAKIKELQYALQSYTLDINLNPNELLVEKGEIIALSGNTGSSAGPHLHFEIRDTQSEKIINPFFFGFDTLIPDEKKAHLTSLYVYPIGDSTIVNQSKLPIALGIEYQKEGIIVAEKVKACGKIGFGIIATDTDNSSWNSNGIYQAVVSIDGVQTFGYCLNTFSFDETRLINNFIDYKQLKTTKQSIQKLFTIKNYPLSILSDSLANGIITVTPAFRKNILIELFDFNKNRTKICIPVEYQEESIIVNPNQPKSKYYIQSNREAIFSKNQVTVQFPENTFYQNFEMDFDVKDSVLQLHTDIVPAFKNFTITFSDSTAGADSKKFIAFLDEKKWKYCTTKYAHYAFTTYQKTLGLYQIMTDSIPPKISLITNFRKKRKDSHKELKLAISDDLSGIKSYSGFINGKWILLEHESKLKTLTHQFSDGIVTVGKNDLKVITTDNVGNSTIFETQFFINPKP